MNKGLSLDTYPQPRRTAPVHPSASRLQLRDLPGIGSQLVAGAVVCVTPWIFGGVQASIQPWLAAAVACALVLCLGQVISRGGLRAGGLAATALLLAGLGLVAFQLLPLDRSLHERLSPHGVALRKEMESSAPSTDASLAEHLGIPAIPNKRPLSLYPAATRRELTLLSMAAGMFLVGAVSFAAPRAQQWLWILIASNGALLVFLGIVQRLTWNGLLYWQVPLTEGGGPFGPFVNQNNAGGFLNLCLAGALGWTSMPLGKRGRRWEWSLKTAGPSGRFSPGRDGSSAFRRFSPA